MKMKKYIICIFVSFFIIPIYGQEDLWDVIRENSNFQYSADRSEIQKALKIYQNNSNIIYIAACVTSYFQAL